jgi:hypothetical protein
MSAVQQRPAAAAAAAAAAAPKKQSLSIDTSDSAPRARSDSAVVGPTNIPDIRTPAQRAVTASQAPSLRFVKGKLITKEDKHYLHKVLGAASLLSFLYRYAYCWPMTGTLGFENRTWLDWATMLAHTLLSTSSLIFTVLPKRISHKPAIIWEEYRLHAIVFTMRCFSLFLFAYFAPLKGTQWEQPAQFALVMTHHLVADEISLRYGTSGETTVRGKGKKLKPKIKYLTRFCRWCE